MDIDFMMKDLSNDIKNIENVIREIVDINTGNDFIIFEMKSIEEITEERDYHGIRANIIGKIKNTKTPFHIDIGVGDVIVPKAKWLKLPIQIKSFEKPEVMTYSLESTIAEKFDAIISRMELNSRMKDYYDIFYLANTYCFAGRKLQEAVFQTLQNRKTIYEKDSFKRVYGFSRDADMLIKWKHFIKGTLKIEIEFADVIEVMYSFLNPVFEEVVSENEMFETWNPSLLKYEKNS